MSASAVNTDPVDYSKLGMDEIEALMDAAIAQEIEDAAKEKAGGSRSRKRKGNQNGGTRRSRSSSRTSRSRSSSSKKGSKRGSAGSSSRSSSRSNRGGSGRRRRTKSSSSRGGLPRPHSHPQLKPSRRSLPPLLSKRARAASLRDAVAETYEDVSYFFGAIAFIARMIAKGTAVVGFQYIIVVYLARIFAYGLLLLNGFLKMVYYYFTSPDVTTHTFGPRRRHNLDLYCCASVPPPAGEGKPKPVVIFCCGGAWTIGFKGWGALIGRVLSQLGFVVACPDYPNFPQADVKGMEEAVSLAIQWTLDNCERFGGDRNAVVLMGQSAGAHLAAMSWLEAVISRGDGTADVDSSISSSSSSSRKKNIHNHITPGGGFIRWRPAELRGFVGISGPYDLTTLAPYLEKERGFDRRVLKFIFASGAESKKGKNNNDGNGSVGEKDLRDRQHNGGREGSKVPPRDGFEEHSPTQVARRYGAAAGADPLPLPFPVALFHGTSDVTCPAEQSERFHAALLSAVDSGIGRGDGGAAGARAPAVAAAVTRAGTPRVSLRLFEGLSHTDPIIECPFGGGEDPLLSAIVTAVKGMAPSAFAREGKEEGGKKDGGDRVVVSRLVSDTQVAWARWVCPF